MMQLFFLAQLNLDGDGTGLKKGLNKEEWEQITKLLHEVEMEYFYMLGWPKDGKETKEEIEKIKVTMPTFFHYFFNGPLAYTEQEIEKIETIFKPFEKEIIQTVRLSLNDFINCYDFFNDLINQKTNSIVRGMADPKNVAFIDKTVKEKLTRETLKDPIPAEITTFFKYINNPGLSLVLNLDDITYDSIHREKVEQILQLLTVTPVPRFSITYYTDTYPLFKKPILKISEHEYLNFFPKQILNAIYTYLWDFCTQINKRKILKSRDGFLEHKVAQIFQDFFGKDAHVYFNYSIDDNTSEQDVLVLYKGLVLIIEAKATVYRPPMRDPIRAFDKLKSDFKANIQYAYDQTFRVKSKFLKGEKFTIKNEKGVILYEVPAKKYTNIFSIIVTGERFGIIQSDLEPLLEIDDQDEYAWAVNIHDLEAFLLVLKKRSDKVRSLITFLEYRQNYHGHLICSDELELFGSFLKNQNRFKSSSLNDAVIVTHASDTAPIEAAYIEGMGFTNERYMQEKKDGHTRFLFTK